ESFECRSVGLVDLTGQKFTLPFPELTIGGVPLARDTFGNVWVADVDSTSGAWRHVFYFCHDPPVFFVQSDDALAFLESLLTDDNYATRASEVALQIWRPRGGGLSATEAVNSSDKNVRRFAATVPSHSEIFDLRCPPRTCGVSWQRGHG